jgi:hypothetical protein
MKFSSSLREALRVGRALAKNLLPEHHQLLLKLLRFRPNLRIGNSVAAQRVNLRLDFGHSAHESAT